MGKVSRVSLLAAIFVMMGTSAAWADHVECVRDINNDGKVDSKDTKIIQDAMGAIVGAPPYDERADLDQNDSVTAEDLAAYSHCK